MEGEEDYQHEVSAWKRIMEAPDAGAGTMGSPHWAEILNMRWKREGERPFHFEQRLKY